MVTARGKKPVPAIPAPGEGLRIGYARVSTQEQILDLQIEALKRAGCHHIFEEKVSGSGKQKRPKLDLAMKMLAAGDQLVVWRLDRLARSMDEFHDRMKQISEAGAAFRSLTENFDFTTAMGKFVLGILALVAELERQLTIQRTKAGLDVARAKGKQIGGLPKVGAAKRKAIERDLIDTKLTNKEIAKKHGIGESTIPYLFKGGRRGVRQRAQRNRR